MTAEFAAQLHQLRTERGLSVRDLAALAHCSKSHIYDIETGRRRAAPAVARALDDALCAGGRLAGTRQGTVAVRDEAEAADLRDAYEAFNPQLQA
jgi:transcriptional regulator with XRE-family HTH domain